ncbi:MAG TPA: glycosyl hydrolase [Chthonomonadaceae bacterium]|nr:glycosyl hydrolase [Chthonomonadaceae bacterium]
MALPVWADENRLYLASQSDFNNKRGFYLDFENPRQGLTPCKLDTNKLILGVADGHAWRFPQAVPAWQYDRDYTVRAVIGPGSAELWLDGTQLARSDGGFAPQEGPVEADTQPNWAAAPADYLIVQKSLTLTDSFGRHLSHAFPSDSSRPLGVFLFEPETPAKLPWNTDPDRTLTVEATFRFIHRPASGALGPLIDRYGQARYAEWPGKLRDDADLKAATTEEGRRLSAMPAPSGYDRYGGATGLGWTSRPTGFYHVESHAGKWWLITPEGHPCFYTGVCSIPSPHFEATPVTGREDLFAWLPPREGEFASAWSRDPWGNGEGADYVAFRAANMIRKYGADWEAEVKRRAIERLKRWGFSGAGKWSDILEGVPSLPVLEHGDVPNVARHPDIFDPAIQAKLRESLRRQIAPHVKDSFIVGWSIGNEYDEIITTAEIADILRKPAAVPAKTALVDYALGTLYHDDLEKLAAAWGLSGASREALTTAPLRAPDADMEALRRYFAARYYDFLYKTVKEIDPSHLYLGFWIVPGWWQNEEDWRLIAPYCDVIGYDRYAETFSDSLLDRLMAETKKPVLLGEFSFPPFYAGTRGFGLYSVWSKDDADAGRLYAETMLEAARSAYCVGAVWFEYRDEPLTGRGPGHGPDLVYGEDYAFGVVDEADRPKWDLVRQMRATNLTLAKERSSIYGNMIK